MAQTICQELELANLQAYLYSSLQVTQSDNFFLERIQRQPIRHSVTIHRLHAIIMSSQRDQHNLGIIDKLNLFQKLEFFLRELQQNRLLEQNQLSEYDLTSIIELLEVLLRIPRINQQRIDKQVDASKNILNIIYPRIEHTANQQLLGTLVQCLYLLRKKKNDILKDVIFAELFIKTLNRSQQFLNFFGDYISSSYTHNYEIMDILIRGLTLRLPSLVIDENYRPMLLDTYSHLRDFLKREPTDSVWFGKLLRQENMIIFDVFKNLMAKNCYHNSLSALMDEFVVLYLSANLSNYRKYQFILSFYKYVIQKAPTFFTLINSTILSQEKQFLSWFVAEQLKDNDKIVLTYMTNRFALQFLLVLLICYMFFFPKKVDEISAKMRNIGLLDEAKYFMDYQPLEDYLRVFYDHTKEQEMYQEFLSMIQDSTVSQYFR